MVVVGDIFALLQSKYAKVDAHQSINVTRTTWYYYIAQFKADRMCFKQLRATNT
eukprot:SAG31_NODE_4348_length_3325_cov_1.733416_2_plen_54_part_00